MKLSDDRVNHLSHVIADALAADERVEFLEVWNKVRLRIKRSIIGVLQDDEEMERRAEAKVRGLRRDVREGSPEWDVLLRQFYREEVERLRALR